MHVQRSRALLEQFGLFASHNISDRDDFVGNNYALSRHFGLAGKVFVIVSLPVLVTGSG